MQYSIVGNEEGQNITVFVPGEAAPLVAHSSHPNFSKIVEGVLAGDESVVELFDVSKTVATRFDKLSERVSVANGRLYFDGVEVNNALSTQVVRFLEENVDDWKPLVRFFENVQANPQEFSREQLFEWLSKHEFTITEDGMIVGYKGVRKGEDEDTFKSIFTGKAIVDGELQNGNIVQRKGSVVEMPRNEVTFDPAVGCSYGLHVGTYGYANDFAQGALLEVHVNPRDVVSVPTESNWAKVRCCRYTVVDTIDAPYSTPVKFDHYDDDDLDYWGEAEWDDDTCPDCGGWIDSYGDCNC